MRVAVAVLALLLAPLAQADEWGLGLGAIFAPNPYRDTDATRLPIPVVNYESDNLYWRGIRGGYRVIHSREQTFEAFVLAYSTRFDPDDSDNNQLQALDERKFSTLGGLAYSRSYDWGKLLAELAYDITGHSDGTVAELAYSYPLFAADYRWMIAPQLGLAWFNDSYVDYYAGISAEEAVRSGLASYDGKEAYNPFVALGGFYRITREWQIGLFVRGGWLGEGYSDSPMIERSFVPSGFASVTYHF